MNRLTVKVKAKGNGWEGSVSVPGLQTTKLIRKDGQSVFGTRSALNTVARALATRLASEVVYDEPVKKAAKKSLGSKTKNASNPSGNSGQSTQSK
jgi:hypothetical protein